MTNDFDIFKPSEMYKEYEEEFTRLEETASKNTNKSKQKKTLEKMKLCLKQMDIDIKMVPNYKQSKYYEILRKKNKKYEILWEQYQKKFLFGEDSKPSTNNNCNEIQGDEEECLLSNYNPLFNSSVKTKKIKLNKNKSLY